MSAALVARLESPLPSHLPAGARLAVFCFGTASCGARALDGLELVIDGVGHPVSDFAMPRFDAEPRRSGFWAVVPLHATGREVVLCARAAGSEVKLASIPVLAVPPAPQGGGTEGTIAVCLATHEPPPDRLRAQLDSLRSQTERNWMCIVSDDASSPEGWAHVRRLVDGDERFVASHSERRLGFYGNFERLLELVPPQAELVALCDQDDVWGPDKLATLRARMGDAVLAYSDARLVDEQGRVLRDTLWRGRANNTTNLASMLIANSVTGAAALMRAQVACRALPFPDSPGIEFHDHWLALVALASGRLAYVDEPLYDYVQHRTAVVGKMTGEAAGRRGLRSRLRMREWRTAYFVGYLPGVIRARTLLLRCEEQLTPAKRRALARYIDADRSCTALLWLALRPLRMLGGRTETLGLEWELLPGLVWVRLARLIAALPRWPQRLLLDCRFPDPPLFRQRRLERWRARI